jgi:hypothetical protein
MTWPRHFSQTGMESTWVITLGRRIEPVSMRPRSAACCSRKRYSMDYKLEMSCKKRREEYTCAFSEFRAMMGGVEVLWSEMSR